MVTNGLVENRDNCKGFIIGSPSSIQYSQSTLNTDILRGRFIPYRTSSLNVGCSVMIGKSGTCAWRSCWCPSAPVVGSFYSSIASQERPRQRGLGCCVRLLRNKRTVFKAFLGSDAAASLISTRQPMSQTQHTPAARYPPTRKAVIRKRTLADVESDKHVRGIADTLPSFGAVPHLMLPQTLLVQPCLF